MKKTIWYIACLLLLTNCAVGVDSSPLTIGASDHVVHGYRLDTPVSGDGFIVTVPEKWTVYPDTTGVRQEDNVYHYGMISNTTLEKSDHVDPDTLAIYTVDVAKNGKSFDELVTPLEYSETQIEDLISNTNAQAPNSLARNDIVLETKQDTIGGMSAVINSKKCLKACTPAGVASTNVQYFVDTGDYVLIFIVGTETSKMTDQLLAQADTVIRSVKIVQ